MKTIPQTTETMEQAMETNMPAHSARINRWLEHDMVLNLGFEESIKRCIVALFVPWPFVLFAPHLIYVAAFIMFYLFITGLVHFCFIHYACQHWFHHQKEPAICQFSKDLHIPVKAI